MVVSTAILPTLERKNNLETVNKTLLSLSNVMVNTCGQGSEKKLVRFSELCPNLHKGLFPGILIHLRNKTNLLCHIFTLRRLSFCDAVWCMRSFGVAFVLRLEKKVF